MEITLSDWVFNAVKSQEVLTLHRDYSRLRKPLERRIYELARKHCGHQPTWAISLELLLKKCGSQSPLKRFRQMVKNLARHDHLPDYRVTFEEERDQVIFHNCDSWRAAPHIEHDGGPTLPSLPSHAYESARDVAPGYDIYELENQWREWWASSGKPKIENPSAAFVGFCRARHERAPLRRIA